MNVLITGVNGFVGKYLVEEIKRQFKAENLKIYGTYYGKNADNCASIQLMKMDLTNKDEVQNLVRDLNVKLLKKR